MDVGASAEEESCAVIQKQLLRDVDDIVPGDARGCVVEYGHKCRIEHQPHMRSHPHNSGLTGGGGKEGVFATH